MTTKRSPTGLHVAFLVLATVIAWAGLALQFSVSRQLFPSTISTVWRMLGYFTVLTIVIAFIWSLYIAAYGIYALARGASSGWYPYPFLDLPVIGFQKVVLNTIGLLLAFCAVGLLFVVVDKRWATPESSRE